MSLCPTSLETLPGLEQLEISLQFCFFVFFLFFLLGGREKMISPYILIQAKVNIVKVINIEVS